jgi:5-carboxymethyl-2-hydroxymuconate isomerase
MPHIVIEHSDNLEIEVRSHKLVRELHSVVTRSGLFDPQAVKARSLSFDSYVLPEGAENFLHVTVSILSGRSEAERKKLSSQLFARVKELIPSVDRLSVNIHDMCLETYSK